MPPLKSPAAFHEQIRSLERARTENFLKHKIRSRPERSELVRMHILQETLAEPSLQATQLKLKRARLADDLNEKIAQRPGPMELVEKNILPVDSSVKEAIIVGQVNYPKTLDSCPFEEDSSDALSPEQPASQESQGSAASPGEPEAKPSEAVLLLPSSSLQAQTYRAASQVMVDMPKLVSISEQPANRVVISSQVVASGSKAGPTLVKQSQPKQANDKSRSKKGKEARPRVKKLKYHQYIPPDQKVEPSEAPMDSSYARLLQQQQLFLQLQILSQQQQQHYNYQTILPAPLKPLADGHVATASMALNSNNALPNSIMVSLPTAAPIRPSNTLTNRKPGPLPPNLEEMKVAELKMELKLRGLPVSGTKTDLIERLRPYQESSSGAGPQTTSTSSGVPPASMEVTTSLSSQHLSSIQQGATECMNATPPSSPLLSELSSASLEEVLASEVSKSPHKVGPEEKDRRLHEKERQIEELMRKLVQEQRLVEELKMQLEVEKRGQQVCQAAEPAPAAVVKEESCIPPNCTTVWAPLVQPASLTVKQEEPVTPSPPAPIPPVALPPFFIHPHVSQVLGQPQALIPTQPGTTQILVPVSLPASATTIQLPSASVNLKTQPVVQTAVPVQSQGLVHPSAPRTDTSPSQYSRQEQHIAKTFPLCTTPETGFQYSANQNHLLKEIPQCFLNSSPESRPPTVLPNGPVSKAPSSSPPTFILQPSTFSSHAPKSKDPPRYEEAVKQTRSLQAPTVAQMPTVTSQQMDDLFDILIESGEISPLIRQDLPSVRKVLPVTASVTTLPVNTVLSRPLPQVQLAPAASMSLDSTPSLAMLASDNQLEALLDGTLSEDPEPHTLGLGEELQCQLLEQPHSPMDTSELTFADAVPTTSFDLQDANLDNMEWLDLTMPGPPGGLTPLGISSDILDAHDLHLHWD
uniref:Myocardin related transcription factor B n=1 Tax=Paramormyrops kingsleyae TaxID=1676925 RepID=A0A3B3QIE6_9TELE|nr:MKL/myocardin-like protein 2 [Paramormyrops kingsleyae]